MKNELNVKKFWELLRKYLPLKKNIGILLFLIFSQVFCTLYMPIAVMNTIDISSGNYYEWKKICWIAFIILLQVIFSVGVLYLMSWMAHKIIMQLRDDLWSKVLHLPIEYFDRTETGEIMSRITNDTMVISEFITNDFLSAITGAISIIGSIILIFAVDWKMAAIMVGLVPITVFAISPLNKKLYRISRDFQNKTGEYQARMNNVLTNIRLVKTCIAEEKEEERGKLLTKELFNIGIKGGKITALVQPLTTMLIFLLLILIFGYGSVRVSNGSLSAGSLVAIIYYLFQIATPCMGLTAFVGQLNRSCGAMERISKILNEEIVEKKIKKEIIISDQKCNCGLVLDNISFRYSDRKNTLCSISFFIEKGETLAIVGESGSGKSTIFSLIERFYEQDKGNIYYEGIDVRNIPMNDWRGKIAYVQQESPIMSGTILDNLTYGLDSYNEKNVLSALEKAELNRFISSLPKGYNTDVGEQGVKLSGGQKQRIALARALLTKSPILILDEATSGLDPVMRDEVLDVFLDFIQDEQNSILLSSHITTDLEKVADYIVFIHKGRIIFNLPKDMLLYQYGILRCRTEEFHQIAKEDILAYQKKELEWEVLVADREKAAQKYKKCVIDNATIDEIMLLYIKGEQICKA